MAGDIFLFGAGGANATVDSSLAPTTAFERGYNWSVEHGRLFPRWGFREIEIGGDGAALLWASVGKFQGAAAYNPALGQSQISFAEDEPQIVLAVGGAKFSLKIGGEGEDAQAVIKEITGGRYQSAREDVIGLRQAENYMLAGDGKNDTWIFDGKNALASTGYISDTNANRDFSQIPNAARAPIYAHGRIAVDAGRVLIGDMVNTRVSLTTAEGIKGFTEQVYHNTGAFLNSPSSLGKILAVDVLPSLSVHGHGDVIYHCERGLWSANWNIYPRSKWGETPQTQHLNSGFAARGFYALASFDDGQVFRSARGIDTLKTVLNGDTPERRVGSLSAGIERTILDFDNPSLLHWASLVDFPKEKRFFCTVAPIAGERAHAGLVSYNYGEGAWEGLWRPPKGYLVYQFVVLQIEGRDRLFVFAKKNSTGELKLFELSQQLGYDVVEGDRREIESAFWTKQTFGNETGGNIAEPIKLNGGDLTIDNIKNISWEVRYQTKEQKNWQKWDGGRLEFQQEKCSLRFCKGGLSGYGLSGGESLRLCQPQAKASSGYRVLYRQRGYASPRTISLATKPAEGRPTPSQRRECFFVENECSYSDFENYWQL